MAQGLRALRLFLRRAKVRDDADQGRVAVERRGTTPGEVGEAAQEPDARWNFAGPSKKG
jgi:hypothetical protein